MPYYQFTLTLKTGVPLQFIRQLDLKDIDQVWRIYEKKAKDHYKKQMISFRAVQLSKLDPEVKEWIISQGKATGNTMDELLNTADNEIITTNRKSKNTIGMNLEDRRKT